MYTWDYLFNQVPHALANNAHNFGEVSKLVVTQMTDFRKLMIKTNKKKHIKTCHV